jgi:hypothetical protein
MRTWIKYLIIGWSIVSIVLVIVSFQLAKSDFVKEDYEIMMVLKAPEKAALTPPPGYILDEPEVIAEKLFPKQKAKDFLHGLDPSITKKEFVDKIKKAKGVTIESKTKVDKAIYVILPIYAFLVWGIPILVFSLVGVIFGRGKGNQTKEEPGK